MGIYPFKQSEFDSKLFDGGTPQNPKEKRFEKLIRMSGGKSRGGQVVFVDNEEAQLESNRKKGLNRSGWWHIKKAYKNGEISYRTELLIPAPSNINTAYANTDYNNIGEIFSSNLPDDDGFVSDAFYDTNTNKFLGSYKLYFSNHPSNTIPVFSNQFVTTSIGSLDYSYKLLDYDEDDENNASSLTSVIIDGVLDTSPDIKYFINFQERIIPKNDPAGIWHTFVPIEKYKDDDSFDPEFEINGLSYTPNIDAILDSYTEEDRENNKYEYRAILTNSIGSKEAISNTFEVRLEDFNIDYVLSNPFRVVFDDNGDAVLDENGNALVINGVQSGDLVNGFTLGIGFSVLGIGRSNLREYFEYSDDGITWANMFAAPNVYTRIRRVSEHDYANNSAYIFRLPPKPPSTANPTVFTVADDGFWYRLRIEDVDSQEQYVNEERQLSVVKRSGYFSENIPEEVNGTPDSRNPTKYHLFEIEVKNKYNRDQEIGIGDYALVTKWQYREHENVSWKDFPENRVLGNDTVAVSSAISDVGRDITKAAVVYDRLTLYQIRVSAKAGNNDAETEEIFSNTSHMTVDHKIYITTQPTAIATAPTGNTRVEVTNISANVAFGTLQYQWQLSNDGTSNWRNASTVRGVGANTNSLKLRESDVSGSATTIYARCLLSGGKFAPDIISNTVELTVAR